MKLNNVKGKFTLKKVPMNYDELCQVAPLIGTIASYDLNHYGYHHLSYQLIDGSLYGRRDIQEPNRPISEVWYFYDDSVRRWAECKRPDGA